LEFLNGRRGSNSLANSYQGLNFHPAPYSTDGFQKNLIPIALPNDLVEWSYEIIIRTNPEIVIEVESIKEEKQLEQTIVVPDLKPEPKPTAVVGRGKGVRHCKKCGEEGHRSDNCAGSGGSTMKDKIRSLADEGLSSDEVADKLGLSLAVVNKYW
jgi:hypothetical protein